MTNGTEIADRPMHVGDMWHTYLQAVGLDSRATHEGTQQNSLAAPERDPVKELLA